MSSEPLICPYCNTLIPGAAAVGTRIPCPRCGEAFTLRQPASAAADLQQAPAAVLPAVESRPAARRNNRLVAGVVVGGMVVIAALALAYALYTQPDRRAHDVTRLEVLRWLPPNTTVVASVRIAELRRTERGRDLLRHLFSIGNIELNADMLERWTGLPAEQIEQLAVGIRAEDPVPPCTVLIVRTIRPYDADAVKKALQAEPAAGGGGKALFRCKPQEGGFRPVLWFADAQTLVFGLFEKHLDAVPDRPAADFDALPPEVREVLNQRLDTGGPVWVAGYSKDWRSTSAALLLGALPARDADLLGHVRSFGVQIDAEPQGHALVVLKCDSDDAAQALETRLTAAKPAAADGKTNREGPWLTWQRNGDPAALVPLLWRGLQTTPQPREQPGK